MNAYLVLLLCLFSSSPFDSHSIQQRASKSLYQSYDTVCFMFDIVRQPYSICMVLMRFIVILTQISLEFVRYYVNLIGIR